MKSRNRTITSFAIFAAAFLMVAGLTVRLSGQQPQATGLVSDWSHHHVVFSNPGAYTDAVRNGTAEQWARIHNDPRYQMQQLKRSSTQRELAAAPDFAARMAIVNPSTVEPDAKKPKPGGNDPVKKDWTTPLGSGIKAIQTGDFSAVPTATSASVPGSITINNNGTNTLTLTSNATQSTATGTFAATLTTPITIASGGNTLNITPTGVGTVTFNSVPASGDAVTVGTGQTYTFGTLICFVQSNCVLSGTNTTTQAQNLEAAINNKSSQCGNTSFGTCFYNGSSGTIPNASATATQSGTVVTVTDTTAAGITFTTTSSGITLSPAASIPAPATDCSASAAHFVGSNTTTTEATNLLNLIQTTCSGKGINVWAQASGTTGVQVFDTAFGYTTTSTAPIFNTTGAVTNVFTGWTPAAGSNGSNACTNPYTSGTFQLAAASTPPTTASMASNLATEIAACNSSHAATGVTAAEDGTNTYQVDLTADNAGPAGNNISLGSTMTGVFSWTATPLSGGANATVQPNAYPATYANNGTCSDFAVYPTGQAGSGTAANIIAYDNMYTGSCSGVPTVYWAYNTGAYSVTTSPILSVDGTKVAFIQSNGTTAQLVVLKWKGSDGGTLSAPLTPSTVTNITTACASACMTVTSLSHNDIYSSPFYDFLTDDALYVGDSSGYLEKFTGVFNGSSVTGPTTVQLNTHSYAIASPVYDYSSGCVFAGDTEGYLYKVNSGGTPAGTICTAAFGLNATSEILGNGGANEGIFDAPLVDSTAGKVYVFVTDSAAVSGCGAGQNCVAEFATSFTGASAAPSVAEPLGTGGAGYNLYSGAFDNVWFNSSTSTGNLYVVGNTAAPAAGILYRVTLTTGTMTNVALAETALNSVGYTWASPVTEFCNGACAANATQTTSGTDYLFFSVNAGAASSCTHTAGNGCVLSYSINTTTPSLLGEQNYTNVGTNGCWATGGLVIDNMATATGASQIYFVALSGAAAGGGAGGGTPTSAACSPGVAPTPTIQATQAAQANP